MTGNEIAALFCICGAVVMALVVLGIVLILGICRAASEADRAMFGDDGY